MGTPATVRLVEPSETLELRREVLRPHQSVEEMAAEFAADFAVAAVGTASGAVRSCALALPEEAPDVPGPAPAWRVRGMATDPSYRGAGLGARVLARTLTEIRARGGRTVWCNARTPARTLYERAGFAVVGEPWEEPMIGPHIRMWREL